uniref:Uncharacterized protein n=1 Tax=Vannella robusta TaxID=1487602 RepID=A0A7S4HNV9_9EUKA|mmetsp:Transcript_13507/g.17018  ORF Transcript_13507/g.17018 Transcript_13507/m.17018 type:complete len:110 (+) Transcript_13507:58-387(+)
MQDNTITQALTNESSRLVLKKLWVDTAMDARPSDTTPAALTIYFEVCGYTMNVYDPTQYIRSFSAICKTLKENGPKFSFSAEQSSKQMELISHICVEAKSNQASIRVSV